MLWEFASRKNDSVKGSIPIPNHQPLKSYTTIGFPIFLQFLITNSVPLEHPSHNAITKSAWSIIFILRFIGAALP